MHHFARKIFTPVVLSLAAIPAVFMPAETLACSPPAPALVSTIPTDGAYYPGNGIVLLDGYNISLDQVTATVDGAPATLVDASAELPGHVAPFAVRVAVRVSPKPLPDQKVTISGSFCPNCAMETITYTARADDTVPPDGLASAKYNVHDYADFQSSGSDCQISSDLALWLHAKPVPASEEEAPAMLFVEAFADQALTKSITSTSTVISSTDFAWAARLTTEALQGATPASVCFRLTTVDLAGNAGPDPLVVCQACYSKTDSQSGMSMSPPVEPTWSDADAIKGGPCDWSVGVGGEPEDDGGCSYSASGNRSVSWALLGLGLASFAAARKRAHRARK
jgi:hypothetical protein